MGVAVGDYDLDGRLDIFVANDTMPNFLFRNRGDGTFEEVAAQAGVAFNENGTAVSSMGAEFRDYDNDGREDLFVTALSNETFALFHNSRMASSRTYAGLGNRKGEPAVDGMVERDGGLQQRRLEGPVHRQRSRDGQCGTLVGASVDATESAAHEWQNLVSGRTLAGAALHRGLAWGDFDRDGRVDLVVTRLNQPAQLLWNRTAGADQLDRTGPARHKVEPGRDRSVGGGRDRRGEAVGPGGGMVGVRMLFQPPAAFRNRNAPAERPDFVRWPAGSITELEDVPAGQVVKIKDESAR